MSTLADKSNLRAFCSAILVWGLCITLGVWSAHAGPRSGYKTHWSTCRTNLLPQHDEPELTHEFSDLEAFSRLVFTGDRQITPELGHRLSNITHIPPQLLKIFRADERVLKELIDWLVSGKALQHPDPSIYTFFKQLLISDGIDATLGAEPILTREQMESFSNFIAALSVFSEAEELLEESPKNLTRAHMELEFYIPTIAKSDPAYSRVISDRRFAAHLSQPKNQKYKNEKVSMIHWMQTMGATDAMFKTYMRQSTKWRRDVPDIDIAVHNPKYNEQRNLKKRVKPFLRVCQVKSHIYRQEKLESIFSKLVSVPSLGQMVLFPAELADKRIMVLELRGLGERDFEKVLLEMKKKVWALANQHGIIFQLNGDTRTATIRPK